MTDCRRRGGVICPHEVDKGLEGVGEQAPAVNARLNGAQVNYGEEALKLPRVTVFQEGRLV